MIRIEKGRYHQDGFTLRADVHVPRESFTAVVGPSGAGKTTLLNIIAGFEPLAEGRVLLAGLDMTGHPPASRPLTFVFQDNNWFAHLDCRTNVALGLSPSLRLGPDGEAAVDAALDRVGLSSLARRRPGEMSGGERQRIALARMLVRRKPILLLDEPFAALGPGLRRDMMKLIVSLQRERGLTVVMVTHHPDEVEGAADHILFVDGGVARPAVPTASFFASRNDPAIAAYLGDWSGTSR